MNAVVIDQSRSSERASSQDRSGSRRRTAADRRHSSSRELVLRAIETHGPRSITELAQQTGLHENTVRGHVSRLHADGYVRSETTSTDTPGRPARRWRATAPELLEPYAGLAAVLADALTQAGTSAPALARGAGERWGAKLAADHDGPRADRSGSRDPQRRVVAIMREQGFHPTETRTGVSLRRCPLLAAASNRPEVVCSVHEGMIAGIIAADAAEKTAGAGTPPLHTELTPFAEPGACVLRLIAATAAEPAGCPEPAE